MSVRSGFWVWSDVGDGLDVAIAFPQKLAAPFILPSAAAARTVISDGGGELSSGSGAASFAPLYRETRLHAMRPADRIRR